MAAVVEFFAGLPLTRWLLVLAPVVGAVFTYITYIFGDRVLSYLLNVYSS